MTPAESVYYPLVLLGTGGAFLGLVCLFLEIYLGPRTSRWVSGVLGVIFLGAAAVFWVVNGSSDLTWFLLALALAIPCVGAWAANSVKVQQVVSRLKGARTIWAILLLTGIGLFLGGAWLSSQAQLPSFPEKYQPAVQIEPSPFQAFTDRGRPVSLFKYEIEEWSQALERQSMDVNYLKHRVIQLAGASGTSNCHGWIFTGGRFGVHGKDVEDILKDNDYQGVEQAWVGDLVVYRDELGTVTHSGLVRFRGEDGLVLIESKWGALGLFLHTPDDQPYGTRYHLYRSSRQGHQLRLPKEALQGSMADSVYEPRKQQQAFREVTKSF